MILVAIRELPGPKSPAELYIAVVSIASSSVNPGIMVGSLCVNIVLPEPGGPIISTL